MQTLQQKEALRRLQIWAFPSIAILATLRMWLILYTPNKQVLASIHLNYNDILTNPVMQFWAVLACIVMLAALVKIAIQPSNKRLFFIALGVCVLAMINLLLNHFAVIETTSLPFLKALAYHSYNPDSSHLGYYAWKYGITPAKLDLLLIVAPVLAPVFYVLFRITKWAKAQAEAEKNEIVAS